MDVPEKPEACVILDGRMSRKNLDLTLLMYEVFNRRDLDRTQAATQRIDWRRD